LPGVIWQNAVSRRLSGDEPAKFPPRASDLEHERSPVQCLLACSAAIYSFLRAMPAPAQFAPRVLSGLNRKAPAKPVTAPIAAEQSSRFSAEQKVFRDQSFNGLQMFDLRFISVYQGRARKEHNCH
jgi:hypothetical protein